MGIQEYLLDNKIDNLVKRKNISGQQEALSKIRRVAIFVDEHIAFNDSEYTNLRNLLSLDHTHFSIITYKEKKSNYNEFRGTVIVPKDIGWNGKIKSKPVLDVLSESFDLLIDYTQADQLKKQLIVAMCKARFKVGFSDKKDELYDFMIAVNPAEVSLFNSELVRYLNILKLL